MINKNDPRLTAFVLGELDADESAEIQLAVDASLELRVEVEELRQAIGVLSGAYRNESNAKLTDAQRDALGLTVEGAVLRRSVPDLEVESAEEVLGPSPALSKASVQEPDENRLLEKRSWWPSVLAASLIALLAGGLMFMQQGKTRDLSAVAELSVKRAQETPRELQERSADKLVPEKFGSIEVGADAADPGERYEQMFDSSDSQNLFLSEENRIANLNGRQSNGGAQLAEVTPSAAESEPTDWDSDGAVDNREVAGLPGEPTDRSVDPPQSFRGAFPLSPGKTRSPDNTLTDEMVVGEADEFPATITPKLVDALDAVQLESDPMGFQLEQRGEDQLALSSDSQRFAEKRGFPLLMNEDQLLGPLFRVRQAEVETMDAEKSVGEIRKENGQPLPLNALLDNEQGVVLPFVVKTEALTVPSVKMRTETKTRTVDVTGPNGQVKQVTQNYTVQVPYTENVSQSFSRVIGLSPSFAYQVLAPLTGKIDPNGMREIQLDVKKVLVGNVPVVNPTPSTRATDGNGVVGGGTAAVGGEPAASGGVAVGGVVVDAGMSAGSVVPAAQGMAGAISGVYGGGTVNNEPVFEVVSKLRFRGVNNKWTKSEKSSALEQAKAEVIKLARESKLPMTDESALLLIQQELEKRNALVRKRIKTWRRSKATPNASRLMVGDKDELDMVATQVSVRVDGFRARVLIDSFYYNDQPNQLEGNFKLRLPDDASLYYFAFGESAFEFNPQGELVSDEFLGGEEEGVTQFASFMPGEIAKERADAWRNVKEARMVPKEKAAFAYTQTVRRRVDPALVEWNGAGVFSARVFPLAPKKLHRIVVGYDVSLTQTKDGLVYDLIIPPEVPQTVIDLQVAPIGGATIRVRSMDGTDPDNVVADEQAENEKDWIQRNQRLAKNHHLRLVDSTVSGLRLEIENPGAIVLRSNAKEEGGFFATRVTPELDVEPSEDSANTSAVFLLDTSLSSQPDKFNVWLRMLEEVLNGNRDSLKQFAVVFFNVENRFWRKEYVENSADNVQQLIADCEKLSLEGATDLYGAIERVNNANWIALDGAQPDLFLLSDGAANWGETNLRLIGKQLENENVGRLFAYQTGLNGTAITKLRFLAGDSGGAVFSIASEDEIAKAALAHQNKPWRLSSISVDGATDLMTAGRVEWYYPGQPLTIVGRVADENAEFGNIQIKLEKDGVGKTISIEPTSQITSSLASRYYGQVAVNQLESLDDSVVDVAAAYARHFRITGQTCSLLMLETEADYQRFDIKPQEDLFVIKSKDASSLIRRTLDKSAVELSDPKAQFVQWVQRLEQTPGVTFKIPTALKMALEEIKVDPISNPLECSTEPLSSEFLATLAEPKLDYDAVVAEAKRRSRLGAADDAIRAISSLVERNPGDLVLARDIAFAVMELERPAHAYHLLRRVAIARPFEANVYSALAQCLDQLGQSDQAIIMYEIAVSAQFQNVGPDFRQIVATDYLHVLRKVATGKVESRIADYAKARLDSLSKIAKFEKADLVVSMMWNTDQTDIDLHVVDPTGEECFYEHKNTRAGGQITNDKTDGYGPEMFWLPNAPHGEYKISAKFYQGNENRTNMRTKVYISIYRDFGTKSERVTRRSIDLSKVGTKQEVHSLMIK